MANQNDVLRLLCREDNKVKDTYYGSVHRASFAINGEKTDWDICHIEIPFSPDKEAELMRRFGLKRERLPSFYSNFEKAVVRHINMMKAMAAASVPAIQKSIVDYKAVQYFPRMDNTGAQVGQDFYLIFSPMESFVGTDIIQENGTSLYNINNLAVRLLQTAKTLNDNGFSLGAVDLDSCFYASDESGKRYLKFAYCFYSESEDIHPPVYTEDVRPFIDENVASGKRQNLDSDVRMICAYIWTMLDGRHYTEPNQNAWTACKHYANAPEKFPSDLLPMYAPPEIAALLVKGMIEGANAMRLLQNEIRLYNKRIASKELDNPFISYASPSYLSDPLPEPRKDEPPKTSESEEKSTSSEEMFNQAKKKKTQWRIITPAAIAFVALVICSLFNLSRTRTTRYVMSSTKNVYLAEGKIVNEKLEVYPSLCINGNGDIVSASDPPTILFPHDYVSPYTFVEDIKLVIVDKSYTHYSSAFEEAPAILRDDVIDLREVEGLFYSHEIAADNQIAQSVVDNYGIQQDSILLIRDD